MHRILVVRSSFGDVYETAWVRGLRQLGMDAIEFNTHAHIPKGILGRIEQRLLTGPHIWRVNRLLRQHVRNTRPDVTLMYQGHHFFPETLKAIQNHTYVVGYHNDDFLGPQRRMLRYRHLYRSLDLYQGYHTYREINREELVERGMKNCACLYAYYIPEYDYPRVLSHEDKSRFACDVLFAGHCEPDDRIECLAEAVRAGLDVHVHGRRRTWLRLLRAANARSFIEPRSLLRGDDYRKAICGAGIAACFLSEWNRDQYTRRVFEIPACGAFLLCERTPVMQELYEEGKEAEYFSSVEEFVDKATFYTREEAARKRIAQAGYRRCTTSGYDVRSRMRQWLADVDSWMGATSPRHIARARTPVSL